MYSVGKYTCIAVDLGDGFIKFIPIYVWHVPHTIILKNFCGREMTEYMIKNLQIT